MSRTAICETIMGFYGNMVILFQSDMTGAQLCRSSCQIDTRLSMKYQVTGYSLRKTL